MNFDGNFPNYEQQEEIKKLLNISPISYQANVPLTSNSYKVLYEIVGSGFLDSAFCLETISNMAGRIKITVDNIVIHESIFTNSLLGGIFQINQITNNGTNSGLVAATAGALHNLKPHPYISTTNSGCVLLPRPIKFNNSLKIEAYTQGTGIKCNVSIFGGITV